MLESLLEPMALILFAIHFVIQTLSYYLRYAIGTTELSGLIMIPVIIFYIYAIVKISLIVILPGIFIWLIGGFIGSRWIKID